MLKLKIETKHYKTIRIQMVIFSKYLSSNLARNKIFSKITKRNSNLDFQKLSIYWFSFAIQKAVLIQYLSYKLKIFKRIYRRKTERTRKIKYFKPNHIILV